MRNSCIDCRHGDKSPEVEPCASCSFTNWEPEYYDLEPEDGGWLRFEDEKPTKPGVPIDAIGTYRGNPNTRIGIIYHLDGTYTHGLITPVKNFDIKIWRYMPNPPKEYR